MQLEFIAAYIFHSRVLIFKNVLNLIPPLEYSSAVHSRGKGHIHLSRMPLFFVARNSNQFINTFIFGTFLNMYFFHLHLFFCPYPFRVHMKSNTNLRKVLNRHTFETGDEIVNITF